MGLTKKIELDIQGMTCDSCVLHVEHALKGVAGVADAQVPGWASGQAVVFAQDGVATENLISAVKQAGYSASSKETAATPSTKEGSGSSLEGNQPDDGSPGLMVIGGGSAGFAAAIKGAELGFNVVLVEQGTIGGTCVNVGCVPSKTLIHSAEQYYQAGHSPFQGVHTRAEGFSFSEVIAQKDELVLGLRQKKYMDVLSAYPRITYVQGHARLLGENRVDVDGRGFTPGKILVATGASPWAPPIPGLEEAGYLTSTTAMELTRRPLSIIILGANAVGLEMAQFFSRAGTEVTLLEVEKQVAPAEDAEMSSSLRSYLEGEGIRVKSGFRARKVEKNAGSFRLSGEENGRVTSVEAGELLVATGRRPNTAGMGLEEAGIELGARGEVVVDEKLKTTNPFVYAAGDVGGRDMFVYVAAYGGGLAAENALSDAGRVYDTSSIPRVIFTDPQLATAGLTEQQARAQGHEVKTTVLPMDQVPHALASRDTRGMIKLVADAGTGRLLGAHLLAPRAGEMIQVAVLAIRFGLTVENLKESFFPYLTSVEGVKLAALTFDKDVNKLSCCAG